MNKDLFTAMIKNTDKAGGCGCVSLAESKPVNNINASWLNLNNATYENNQFKEIAYKYDLISGKVNEVHYQPGAVDQFYHRYDYDAENRITDVYTSDNKIYIGHKNLEEHEAFYEYYKHGPLARAVIGQQQVQGIDYAYTVQGWLKAVNSLSGLPNSNACPAGTVFDELVVNDRSQNGAPDTYTAKTSITFEDGFESLSADDFETVIDSGATPCDIAGQTLAVKDMGDDGSISSLVAKDAYSFGLHYYNEAGLHDYAPVGQAQPLAGATPPGFGFTSLYNGNIAAMSVNVPKIGQALLYSYQYDQLNRLVSMDAYKGLNPQTNSWEPVAINDYKEKISYDANGNILSYKRNGDAARANGTGTGMDDLAYAYKPGTNQLDKVTDAAPDAASGEYDKYKDIKQGQQNSNYKYDAIGNLISDSSENITNIDWTVYGKIKSISKKDGSTVAYTYDAAGNRISKIVTPADGPANTTWYMRDATGNIMAVYTIKGSDSLYLAEQDLYGSSRLGVYNRNINVDEALPEGINANLIGKYLLSYFTRDHKNYELDNHLGNVLATVSDKKVGLDTNGDGLIDYYNSDVVSANDYYPFGTMMPGRKYTVANTNYRYGFNGKELDKETSATTTYDYGFRIYSPTLGRFFSVDPLTAKYPMLTPYQFASNIPISGVDLDGLELYFSTTGKLIGKFGKDLSIRVVYDDKVAKQIKDDVKKKLNVASKEFSSYHMGNNELNEVLRQYDKTATSPIPIGYAAVVDSKDNIIAGTSKQATIIQTKDGPLTTTPEELPNFTPPSSPTDASSTKIIHSHPIQVYTVDVGKDNKYEFSVMRDGDVLPNFNSPAYQIINVENTAMKGIGAEKPSDLDLSNTSIKNKGYTLIIVGLLTPNKLVDVNPTSSSSPKKIQAGDSGAKFYNNNFTNKLFQLNAEALNRIKKNVDNQTEDAAKENSSQTTNKHPSSN